MFSLFKLFVYLILSNSSNIFSESNMRSLSFKTVRSASIRRIMAVISDLPTNNGDDQPSASSSKSVGSYFLPRRLPNKFLLPLGHNKIRTIMRNHVSNLALNCYVYKCMRLF
ncbi:hypothetical protein MKX03_000101 [Papaver bracteatum]|nr:hypothetical protein MKX03_000101 [Papaver bracteatum]